MENGAHGGCIYVYVCQWLYDDLCEAIEYRAESVGLLYPRFIKVDKNVISTLLTL